VIFGERCLLGYLQERFGLLTPNARKVVQKFVEALAMPEMLNKRGDRNACSGEDRGSALNVWIPVENLFAFHGTSCGKRRGHEARMKMKRALPVG
jgi:hypothetical protein